MDAPRPILAAIIRVMRLPQSQSLDDLYDAIPDEQAIINRMRENAREAVFLRSLLRASRRKREIEEQRANPRGANAH
jgi:hypothetical protein